MMVPYQFAFVRYVNDVTGGEFANVGVVVFDTTARTLQFRLTENVGRFSEFFGGVDLARYRLIVRQLIERLDGASERLRTPDLLDQPPVSFREILETIIGYHDSCFQASDIMSGVAGEPAARLDELYSEFVHRYEQFATHRTG